MKSCFAPISILAVASSESFEDIVSLVNSKATSWTAALPMRVSTTDETRRYLGAFLPGDARYRAPSVKEFSETLSAVPASFDARTQWPNCTGIAEVRDQSSCGSCWAFGSVDSFQDRACIATGLDIRYSPEDTAFCSDAGDGCNGGNTAWDWFQLEGVVTGGKYDDIGKGDSCLPYSLAPCAHHVPATSKYPACPSGEYPSPTCSGTCSESGYKESYTADKVKASSSYSVQGVSQIQFELFNYGPLYVAFEVYADFETYKSGVYKHTTGDLLGGHAVELIGWGTQAGEDYWLIKNSWNEQWGDAGTFKIARGTNECGIEESVSAGRIAAGPSPGPSPGPPGCKDEESSDFCGMVLSVSQCADMYDVCMDTCGCCIGGPTYCPTSETLV
jgi:cathepsin B